MTQDFKQIETLLEEFIQNMEDIVSSERRKEAKEKLDADFEERITIVMFQLMAMESRNNEDLDKNPEYQKAMLEFLDLAAITIIVVAEDNEIKSAMPDGLKDQSTVDFFEKQGAKNMASLLKKAM